MAGRRASEGANTAGLARGVGAEYLQKDPRPKPMDHPTDTRVQN